jgi:predicted AAA+ superfamily ATPase
MSTGSAALMLNTNADIARRTVFEKMLPLSFTEYLKITKEKYEIPNLAQSIREALWNSRDAKESYERLDALMPSVNEYYMGVMRADYEKYLWYGSLPHMVDYGDESIVYEQIQKTLDRIIHSDLPMVKFHPDTVSTIPAILYALADMDSCSVSKMTQRFDLSRPKIEAILEALEGAELLRRIYPQ